MKNKDYDGKSVVNAVRMAYDNNHLPEDVCFHIAEIDHTIEGTTSVEETNAKYNKYKPLSP